MFGFPNKCKTNIDKKKLVDQLQKGYVVWWQMPFTIKGHLPFLTFKLTSTCAKQVCPWHCA